MNTRIMRIARHRMGSDGQGVSTLVAFWGCPLKCRYCINDFCHNPNTRCEELDPEQLVCRLMTDEIYYRLTGGGVVFGGGEPLLNSRYIRNVIELLPDDIPIRVETSLNVRWEDIEILYGMIDEWIIDVKDLNPEIYLRYTGLSNENVIVNCKRLVEQYRLCGEDSRRHLIFRVPLIPGYNTPEDVEKSAEVLKKLGIVDRFTYKKPEENR